MKTVLIHGLGQDASAWKDVIPLLPDKNVLTMDLSELIGSGTWQELSNGFAARIDSLEEPVLLCGISLGAVLALDYAAGNAGIAAEISGAAVPAHAAEFLRGIGTFQKAVHRADD